MDKFIVSQDGKFTINTNHMSILTRYPHSLMASMSSGKEGYLANNVEVETCTAIHNEILEFLEDKSRAILRISDLVGKK